MRRGVDSFAGRIGLAVLGTSLAAIALFAGLLLVAAGVDFGAAGRDQEHANVRVLTVSLQSAYLVHHRWAGADLSPTVELARADGLGVTVTAGGRTVLTVPAPEQGGEVLQTPITAGGRTVGEAAVTTYRGGLSPEDRRLQRTIVRTALVVAAAALVLAAAGSILLGRRIARPLARLTRAVRRVGGGRPSRVGPVGGPGELRQLGSAFDQMAEHLEEEDRLRRAVIADVAHELRTPLAVLQAESAALSEGVLTWGEEAAGSFDEEVGKLVRLVEDLGVLAAADAARLTLSPAPMRLDDATREVVRRLGYQAAARQVRVDVGLQPVALTADGPRVEQIVANLLGNAIKFTPPGTTVSVRVWQEGPRACVSVTDAGPGIPEGDAARIFQRFYRGSGAAAVPGTGVGLAVVDDLVRAHGGSVRVTSPPGAGATFTVELPVAGAGDLHAIDTATP